MSSRGQGSLARGHKNVPVIPFPAGAAKNGLSVDSVSGRIVLGQDPITGPGGPAALLNFRQIQQDDNTVQFINRITDPSFFTIEPNQITGFSLVTSGQGFTIAYNGGAAFMQIQSDVTSGSVPPFYELQDFVRSFRMSVNNGIYRISDGNFSRQYLSINQLTNVLAFGELAGLGNSSKMTIDDPNKAILFSVGANGGVTVNKAVVSGNSPFAVAGLTAFANNAAAIVGGLTVGDFYRIGDTVAVVH